MTVIERGICLIPTPSKQKLQIRRQMSYSTTRPCLTVPALCASAKRTSVMLLGSLRDLPRCSPQSSSRPSDDAMVSRKALRTNDGRHHRQPRSPASKCWSRFNVAGLQQLQLLLPRKERCWGNPLRAQHHAPFRCCT